MKKPSARSPRFYATFFLCKTKQIKRFCYLIKWHGNRMLLLSSATSPDDNRIRWKSHHANACVPDNCNLHFSLPFLSQRTSVTLEDFVGACLARVWQRAREKERRKKKKTPTLLNDLMFCLLQHFGVINSMQSFSLTIVSPLVVLKANGPNSSTFQLNSWFFK